jgi:hypothetical protein
MDKYKIKQNFPHNFCFRGPKLNVTEINIFFFIHFMKKYMIMIMPFSLDIMLLQQCHYIHHESTR